jgi:hypothetical protein
LRLNWLLQILLARRKRVFLAIHTLYPPMVLFRIRVMSIRIHQIYTQRMLLPIKSISTLVVITLLSDRDVPRVLGLNKKNDAIHANFKILQKAHLTA